jgi:hypothetical protein
MVRDADALLYYNLRLHVLHFVGDRRATPG